MATRAEVAQRAGVSPSTVSYVLSGKRSIGVATRKRVLAAVKELNYQPNHAAAALAGGKSKVIALLAPGGKSGFSPDFVEYINGVSQAARAVGWHLMVYSLNDTSIKDIHSFYIGGLLDGAILMQIEMNDPRVEYLRGHYVPHVAIGRTENPRGLLYVDRDFEADAKTAVEYLHQLGHRSLVLIRMATALNTSKVGADFRFYDAISKHAQLLGMKFADVIADNTAHDGSETFVKIQKNHPDATAVITLGDLFVISFLNAARKNGVEIPRDLSVLALSVPESHIGMSYPPLTSLTINDEELGFEAGKMLIKKIMGEEIAEKGRLWSGVLQVRDTTAPVQ